MSASWSLEDRRTCPSSALWKFSGYWPYRRLWIADIHGYPRKICGYGKGVGMEGGATGALPRNAETTGATVSFRLLNIFPDFCMLYLKLPVVIYLVFYCKMHDNCHDVAYN